MTTSETGPTTRRGAWELVDNDALGTHREALAELGSLHGLPIHVATGYVGLDGLQVLAGVGDAGESQVRLLLGATPSSDGITPTPPTGAADRFAQSMSNLRRSRDFGAFPEARRLQLEQIHAFIARDTTQVRRYVERFLHGKAYIFAEYDNSGGHRAALVTSANLTGAGLNSNLELGMVHYQPNVVGMTLDWYDRLWEHSEDFKGALLDLLLPNIPEVDPETVYLRALYELFGDEPDQEDSETELQGFQRDGYLRAKSIMDRHGGVLYADGVGMGKTEIGVEFVRDFMLNKGQQVLVIAPASLRDALWKGRLAEANVRSDVVSYNELANDLQLSESANARRHLEVDKDAYRLVVVDEAHAYRNADSTWWLALDRLMSGTQKSLLMLTATPVNNTLWDLHSLFLLFARHDAAFANEPLRIPSLRQYFHDAGATDADLLSPGRLFKLMDALVVRRHREFVMKHYPGETIGGGIPVKFPTPKLIERRYDLDEELDGATQSLVTQIESLTMARYQPSAYLVNGDPDQGEVYNAGFLQSMLLKRLESSWYAALRTVERMRVYTEVVIAAFEDQGVVPTSRFIEEVLKNEDGGDSYSSEALESAVTRGDGFISAESLTPDFIVDVQKDLKTLKSMQEGIEELGGNPDPKLGALAKVMRSTNAKKVVVFSQFKETADYLNRSFGENERLLGGRNWVAVIGSETSQTDRIEAVHRFVPGAEVEGSQLVNDDEVDVLLSTDVLSEGQNLQEAQAVVSYDMPWNPQRVVQRNGRVIRLKSRHDEVYLYTLLAEQGALTEILKLEAKLQAKIEAANASIGMENPVLESVEQEQRNFATMEDFTRRLADGDDSLLDETEGGLNAAFSGEDFRADLKRAKDEGELAYIKELPWGVGAAFTQQRNFENLPAVFFACRTSTDQRYWRMVSKDGRVLRELDDLEMLLRIRPGDSDVIPITDDWDLSALFDIAAKDIVRQHNALSDPAAIDAALPASQRWAVERLREASTANKDGDYATAESSLRAGRNRRVIRELSRIRTEYADGNAMSIRECADKIVEVVGKFGLAPIELPEPTSEITIDDLGVVCYQVVEAP